MFHRSSIDRESSSTGRWSVLGALALILAVAAPSQAWAQGGQGQRQTMMEYRQVNKQLQDLQQRAIKQDSSLRARQQQLAQFIRDELRSLDDSTAARVDRLEQLQSDLRTASQQQDTAGARSAMKEMRNLQRSLVPARKKIMKRPGVRKRIKQFQQAVRERMTEMSPQADSLIQVRDSLRRELQGGMGGPGGGR